MTTPSSDIAQAESKDNILRRLKKIEGQVKGLQRMVESDQYCGDVLIQVAAARAALNRVGTMIIETHYRHCLTSALANEGEDVSLDELIGVLTKFVK